MESDREGKEYNPWYKRQGIYRSLTHTVDFNVTKFYKRGSCKPQIQNMYEGIVFEGTKVQSLSFHPFLHHILPSCKRWGGKQNSYAGAHSGKCLDIESRMICRQIL